MSTAAVGVHLEAVQARAWRAFWAGFAAFLLMPLFVIPWVGNAPSAICAAFAVGWGAEVLTQRSVHGSSRGLAITGLIAGLLVLSVSAFFLLGGLVVLLVFAL